MGIIMWVKLQPFLLSEINCRFLVLTARNLWYVCKSFLKFRLIYAVPLVAVNKNPNQNRFLIMMDLFAEFSERSADVIRCAGTSYLLSAWSMSSKVKPVASDSLCNSGIFMQNLCFSASLFNPVILFS